MKLHVILSALLMAALPGLAIAAEIDTTKRVDKRQNKQDRRIERGVESGDLKKKEAARLKKGQARVDATEKKAAADGKITRKERKSLDELQDEQNQRIRAQRQDGQDRARAK